MHIIVEGSFTLYDCGRTARYWNYEDDQWTSAEEQNTENNYKTIGGVITGNMKYSGTVCINESGSFTMNGGNIFGNKVPQGGGVYVSNGSAFAMNGGTICGNEANSQYSGGGGVFLGKANFTMTGGTICDNTASNKDSSGGGVCLMYGGSFTMTGGEISGNTAGSYGGGGVDLNNGYGQKNFLTIGGTAVIKNNTKTVKFNKLASDVEDTEEDNIIEISSEAPPQLGMSIGLGGYEIVVTKATSGQEKYFFANEVTRYVEFKSSDNTIVLDEIPLRNYKITVNSGEGGVVTADKPYAKNPETVTLTVTPNEGYQLKSLTANDGSDIQIVDNKFTMGSNPVTVTAEFEKAPDPVAELTHESTTTQYPTFAEALAAAGEGDTVKLLDDITVTEQITIDRAITLDGNSKSIKAGNENWPEEDSDKSLLLVTGSGVTIKNITLDPNEQAKIGLNFYQAVGTIDGKVTIGQEFLLSSLGVVINASDVMLAEEAVLESSIINVGVGESLKDADTKPTSRFDASAGTVNGVLIFADLYDIQYGTVSIILPETGWVSAERIPDLAEISESGFILYMPTENQDAPAEREGYTIDYENETLEAKEDEEITYEISSSNEDLIELEEDKIIPGRTYYIRKAAGGMGTSGILLPSDWAEIQVPVRPALNTTASATNNKITVKPVEGAKYKLGDGDWQDSNVFEDLTAGTTYTVYVKIPATDSAFASEEQTISVTTLNAQIVTEGEVVVEVQGETKIEEAKVDDKITGEAEKTAADAIAGAINNASSGENKSNIVDLTEVVNNRIKEMTLDSVQALAEEKGNGTALSKLLTDADNAKEGGKTVDLSMKMTTDINVQVTDVKVEQSETSQITTFTLDIKPVYTLVVESTINGEASGSVTVAQNEPLEVTETTTVSFPAPDGFELSDDDVLYVVHEKENVQKYTYVANFDSETGMISFTNPHGFSEFSLVKASGMVAQNVTTEVFYEELTAALEAAEENQTIVLLKNLTDDEVDLVEIAPNVTLDLNGFDLKADLVVAFGLVKDSIGTGKLIVAVNHFAYFGGKEMPASDENVMPVWDTDGYVFYAVESFGEEWQYGIGNTEGHNPKYRFQPHGENIDRILADNSGVKIFVEFKYTKTTTDEQAVEQTHDYHLVVEFGRTFITQFLENTKDTIMYVSLLGTENVSKISARAYLIAEKSGLSIVSDVITTPASY